MGGRTEPDGSVAYADVDHTDANDLPGATLTPEDPLAGIDQIAQQVHGAGRTALIEALARAGVTVTAPPTGPNPESQLPANYGGDPRVAAYVSPPYRQYAKLILKVSQNLGANLALCTLATSQGRADCFDAFPTENKPSSDRTCSTDGSRSRTRARPGT